jgi:hypothetical protein
VLAEQKQPFHEYIDNASPYQTEYPSQYTNAYVLQKEDALSIMPPTAGMMNIITAAMSNAK